MDNPQWREGTYDTSFIPRYNILDQVIEHVKEMKSQSSGPKVAAAMAAVQAVNVAMSQQNQPRLPNL